MATPTPKEDPEEAGTPDEQDPLDQVESSAWADIKDAISSGDDERGIAALRDFIRACMKREASEEYAEE